MRIPVILAVSAFLGLPAAAVAQQSAAECLCMLPSDAGSPIAAVGQVQGQVLLSGTGGYTPIESGAALSAGDRVVLLDDGQAVLTGPACRVSLAPESTISLVPAETGVCVAQATTLPGALPGGPRVAGGPNPGLIIAGGVVGTGIAAGVITALSEGESPSPVSP